MSHFIQLHLLTAYPPSNLNRDDLGRPKTAIVGGAQRLRISSQSLKRHWRTSPQFEAGLAGHLGQRTRMVPHLVEQHLLAAGVKDKQARELAKQIGQAFGKVEPNSDKCLETRQLVHLGAGQLDQIMALADTLAREDREPNKEELVALRATSRAADIALFGRMLAEHSSDSVEAACQVAHAVTVHAAEVEDDYFTAVDDLNAGAEHRGSAHIGEAGFGAGLFYSYACIDRQQLIDNLDGDSELAARAVASLVETMVRVSPKGKKNSYGSMTHASYVLAECGDQQPRSLVAAFYRPVVADDLVDRAAHLLERQAACFDNAYGAGADRRFILNAHPDYAGPHLDGGYEQGSLEQLIEFLKADGDQQDSH